MRTADNFLLVTLNCIMLAIATGLVTTVILVVVVLLMNARTDSANLDDMQGSRSTCEIRCIVFHHTAATNDDARI